MKSFIATAAIIGAALAQLDQLPPCGQTCINNMLGQASALGCANDDAACLCANADFGYGVRDCTNEACPADADRNAVIQYGLAYCSSVAAGSASGSAGSASGSALAATSALTAGGGASGGAGGAIVTTITSGDSTI